jgi:NAD-dependent dihydropyrimidine dehydrogenase PreA subunit
MNTSVGDYPQVTRAHLDVAKNYSSVLLIGPPICDELIALVEHMFTEEEAEVVRHLKPWIPRTAASLARASSRPLGEVKEIMHRLAHERYIILSIGRDNKELFLIMPIVPGTFENVLVRKSPQSASPWHRRFAELYEALFGTGFAAKYHYKPVNAIRYLPVGEVVRAEPMALPSDRLEEIMERFDDFAVGVCQCRLSRQMVGEGCGRMLETCTVMGDFAPELIRSGRMKQASRKDILEIKAAAEKEGLVTWMMNDESSKFFKCSCSCCGCCCGALRQISEFNAPGMIAPPHFMPHIDSSLCNECGACVKACPMGALVMEKEGEEKRLVHKPERCIGCGLCVVACPQDAMIMREVPGYREPPAHLPAYLARYGRNYVINGLKAWYYRQRA